MPFNRLLLNDAGVGLLIPVTSPLGVIMRSLVEPFAPLLAFHVEVVSTVDAFRVSALVKKVSRELEMLRIVSRLVKAKQRELNLRMAGISVQLVRLGPESGVKEIDIFYQRVEEFTVVEQLFMSESGLDQVTRVVSSLCQFKARRARSGKEHTAHVDRGDS